MSLYDEPEKLEQLDYFVKRISEKFEIIEIRLREYCTNCFEFDMYDIKGEFDNAVTILSEKKFGIYGLKQPKWADFQIDGSSISEVWEIMFYLIDSFKLDRIKVNNDWRIFYNEKSNLPFCR